MWKDIFVLTRGFQTDRWTLEARDRDGNVLGTQSSFNRAKNIDTSGPTIPSIVSFTAPCNSETIVKCWPQLNCGGAAKSTVFSAGSRGSVIVGGFRSWEVLEVVKVRTRVRGHAV
jgi:hypothetical protein